ncbi:MAG: sigma 54-interacting transcriptional regulator [Holdemanella porci]
MYPDEKVCVLLKGEIGTGKEYFAHLMYEYAKEKKLLSEDGKFTVFDVSYYVDSPKEFEIDFYGDAGALETSVGGMLFVKHAELLDGNQIKRLFDVLDNMDKEVFVACGAEQNSLSLVPICWILNLRLKLNFRKLLQELLKKELN